MSKPFGLRDKIGYLMGDIGNDFTFVLSSTFLLKFYTDVMSVPAAASLPCPSPPSDPISGSPLSTAPRYS